MLCSAERVLKYDVPHFVQAGWVPRSDKDKSDLPIYSLCEAGGQRGDQIGQLFGVIYLSVSHAVRSLKTRIWNNQKLLATFNRPYSQFKL